MKLSATFEKCIQPCHVWWLAAACGLVLTLWWPGDIKWVNDAPKSLHIAYQANEDGRLAPEGIDHPGSTGIMYPPVPSWFYQGLLLVTGNNLVGVALLQNLIFTSAMLVLLWLIARDLEWSPWPALLVLVSPYLYLYNRQFWDNTQLIPMGVLLLWLVVRFAGNPRQWHLYCGFFMAVWMFHIHTVTSPLIAAWGLAMLLAGHDWLRRHWKRSLAAALAAAAAVAPFILSFIGRIDRQEALLTASPLIGFFQGFNGLLFFTGQGLEMHVLPEMRADYFSLPAPLLDLLLLFGWLGALFFVMGLAVGGRALYRQRRQPPGAWSPADHAAIFCGLSLLFTCILYAATRQPGFPHYFNAGWIAFFYFIWLGVRLIVRHLVGKLGVTLYAVALAVIVVSFAHHIHRYGGNRDPRHGPTLSTQIEMAQRMLPYKPQQIVVKTELYRLFPHALGFLLTILDDRGPEADERPAARFTVRYRDAAPPDAHLTVDIEPVAPEP